MVSIAQFTEEDAKKPYSEFFKDIPADEAFDLKECPYEDKVRFMRYVMGDSGLINTSLLTNIILLVSAQELSDEVFADDKCVFNSLLEYVDMKTDLITEIKEYTEKLLMYFYSAIKSYSTVLPDNKIDIPMAYYTILMILKIGDISKMMNRVVVDTANLDLVNDASTVVNHYFITSNIVDDFVNYIMNQ